MFAYVVAVTQRSSMGVAAVEATSRFEIAATVLSFLAVGQVVVYTLMQVPVGVFIDRYGPRAPLLIGAALMAVGQAVVAISPNVGIAILGRALVGAGDAMTFPAGMRILTQWIAPQRAPFVTQLFGQIGSLGQLVSAFPFLLLLHGPGWMPAFLSAAALSVIAFVVFLAVSLTAGEPPQRAWTQPIGLGSTMHHLLEALRRPGTQLGFWAHFVSQSSVTTFTLLWGFPYLTVGCGLAPAVATTLIALTVPVGFVSGPLLGLLSARFPLRRSNLVLGIVIAMGIVWAVVLAWPTVPPLWLLVVLIVVIAVGGPGSLIGFDYARTYNPARQLGSANGVVNVGGFLATFTMMLLIGVVLDAIGGSAYSLAAFRVAFLVQYVVIGGGVVMLLWTRGRTRRVLEAEEGITVAPLWLVLARRMHRSGPAA